MIRGYSSSIIASFVIVFGTACTDVEPNADEPSADVQPPTADPSNSQAQTTTAQEALASSYTQVGLGDCTFAVTSPSPSGRNGFAVLGCPNNENLQLQVCLQQLVTGGWQTINWTCTTTHSLSYYVDEHSGKVPYYTNGRWYRTWAWGYANGASRPIVSSGFQG
jgi:hypothetical protein